VTLSVLNDSDRPDSLFAREVPPTVASVCESVKEDRRSQIVANSQKVRGKT
jgi:hypothetical protein